MHYFTPTLCTPEHEPQERRLTDKFGGLPDGFPPQLWPVCAGCGCLQSFSAQFEHGPERLDLGRPGRRLFLFQCAEPESVGMCETWEASSGTNAAIVVEPEGLIMGKTHAPADGLTLEAEVLVASWSRQDDGIDPEAAASYFSDDGLYAMSDEDQEKPHYGTKLGGVPAWVQGAHEVDHTKWRFLGQMASYHVLDRDGVESTMDAANYGGGQAYVFLDRRNSADTPLALVFWQC